MFVSQKIKAKYVLRIFLYINTPPVPMLPTFNLNKQIPPVDDECQEKFYLRFE